jgi:hypothetical protein
MVDAPRQNWALYAQRCRHDHVQWLQGLSAADGLALLESFRHWAASVADAPPLPSPDDSRWRKKLNRRRQMCEYLTRLDRLQSERRTA